MVPPLPPPEEPPTLMVGLLLARVIPPEPTFCTMTEPPLPDVVPAVAESEPLTKLTDCVPEIRNGVMPDVPFITIRTGPPFPIPVPSALTLPVIDTVPVVVEAVTAPALPLLVAPL